MKLPQQSLKEKKIKESKMKKIIIAGIIIAALVIFAAAGFYFLAPEKEASPESIGNNSNQAEENPENNTPDIIPASSIHCGDYDKNQAECISHEECKWNEGCDPISGDGSSINPALEAIQVPDTLPNTICKKLPLSTSLPYGERYSCLAVVNHDARFCEGIDEEMQKDICLAHANNDPSYCKNLETEEAKHTCYYKLAVVSENGSFCSDITYNQNEKEQCYFNVMSNLYQWGRSDDIKAEYCSNLGSPDDNTCLALKARDISKCGSNANCLTFFPQPLSFCNSRSDYVGCIKDRAKYDKNVSICDLLSSPTDRDSCIGVYCTHIDFSIDTCDKIQEARKKQEVYIELAIFLKIN